MTSTTTAGFTLEPVFTAPGAHGFDGVEFRLRDALIQSGIRQDRYSSRRTRGSNTHGPRPRLNIVASKYFHGALGTPGARTQRQAAHLARRRYNHRGRDLCRLLRDVESANAFQKDLKFLLVRQKVAFNSPVFFNVGCAKLEPSNDGGNWHWNPETKEVEFGHTGYSHPQCSACFINSVAGFHVLDS